MHARHTDGVGEGGNTGGRGRVLRVTGGTRDQRVKDPEGLEVVICFPCKSPFY